MTKIKKVLQLGTSLFVGVTCLLGCSNKNNEKTIYNGDGDYTPNIVVSEVGEFVKYTSLNPLYSFDEVNGKYKEYSYVWENLECVLYFESNGDYDVSNINSGNSNDYFIVDGDNRISPLDLKVGDKLYFNYTKFKQTYINSPDTTTTQPYLVYPNKASDDNNQSVNNFYLSYLGTELYLC